jgi:hypothetical protein
MGESGLWLITHGPNEYQWTEETMAAVEKIKLVDLAVMTSRQLTDAGITDTDNIKTIVSYQSGMPSYMLPFGLYISMDMLVTWTVFIVLYFICDEYMMDYRICVMLCFYQIVNASWYPCWPIWRRALCDTILFSTGLMLSFMLECLNLRSA